MTAAPERKWEKYEPCARRQGCATPFSCDRGDVGSTCIYRALQEYEQRHAAATPKEKDDA